MNDWLLVAQVAVDLVAAVILIVLAMLARKPSRVSLSLTAMAELGLMTQLIASIALVSEGQRAKQDTVEFFIYIAVALVVPVLAGFWAFIERTRWSTLVLAAASLTVVVMLFRMQQLWLG